jgi:hypothetical protein
VVVGSLLVIGMASFYLFSRSVPVSSGGLPFVDYLTIANILILCFTTFWSFRYTRLARRMNDPERCPAPASLVGTAWTGTTANTIGMFFSMVVILLEVANLLFFYLKSPQAGVPVIQASGTESSQWVSALDVVSLMALTVLLFAELIVLMFSLRLLYRASQKAQELTQPAEAKATAEPARAP